MHHSKARSIVPVLGVLVPIVGIVVSVVIWDYDRKPELHYDSVRYDSGYTYITVSNKPGTGTAIISNVYYTVHDPSRLQAIALVDPPAHQPLFGDSNNVDSVYFTEGRWDSRGHYQFAARVSYHIAPGKPDDLQLAVINPQWHNFEFVGTLIIPYNGKQEFRLNRVTIVGRSQ